jgi:hypothetical protein
MKFFCAEVYTERKSVLSKIRQGDFTDDFGLFETEIAKNESGVIDISNIKEIIEPRDVIQNGNILLPLSTTNAIKVILDDDLICQSAKRFQEALILDQQTLYDYNDSNIGQMIVPYQLIAFVASIEVLIDTSPKNVEIPCTLCGTPIQITEHKIVQKFNSFIEELLPDSPLIEKAFKDLYQDRSKFVHAGKDLYDPLAFLGDRPLILDGKKCLETVPNYYHNIGDFTGLLLRKYIYRKIKFNQ